LTKKKTSQAIFNTTCL